MHFSDKQGVAAGVAPGLHIGQIIADKPGFGDIDFHIPGGVDKSDRVWVYGRRNRRGSGQFWLQDDADSNIRRQGGHPLAHNCVFIVLLICLKSFGVICPLAIPGWFEDDDYFITGALEFFNRPGTPRHRRN